MEIPKEQVIESPQINQDICNQNRDNEDLGVLSFSNVS